LQIPATSFRIEMTGQREDPCKEVAHKWGSTEVLEDETKPEICIRKLIVGKGRPTSNADILIATFEPIV
jgi:hypothetical protein